MICVPVRGCPGDAALWASSIPTLNPSDGHFLQKIKQNKKKSCFSETCKPCWGLATGVLATTKFLLSKLMKLLSLQMLKTAQKQQRATEEVESNRDGIHQACMLVSLTVWLTSADQLSGQSLYTRTMVLNSNKLVYYGCTMACSRPGLCLDPGNDKMHTESLEYMVWTASLEISACETMQVVWLRLPQ